MSARLTHDGTGEADTIRSVADELNQAGMLHLSGPLYRCAIRVHELERFADQVTLDAQDEAERRARCANVIYYRRKEDFCS